MYCKKKDEGLNIFFQRYTFLCQIWLLYYYYYYYMHCQSMQKFINPSSFFFLNIHINKNGWLVIYDISFYIYFIIIELSDCYFRMSLMKWMLMDMYKKKMIDILLQMCICLPIWIVLNIFFLYEVRKGMQKPWSNLKVIT